MQDEFEIGPVQKEGDEEHNVDEEEEEEDEEEDEEEEAEVDERAERGREDELGADRAEREGGGARPRRPPAEPYSDARWLMKLLSSSRTWGVRPGSKSGKRVVTSPSEMTGGPPGTSDSCTCNKVNARPLKSTNKPPVRPMESLCALASKSLTLSVKNWNAGVRIWEKTFSRRGASILA